MLKGLRCDVAPLFIWPLKMCGHVLPGSLYARRNFNMLLFHQTRAICALLWNNSIEVIRWHGAIVLLPTDTWRLYVLREPLRPAAKPNNPTISNAKVSGSGTC